MLRQYQGAEKYLEKILAFVLNKTTNEALIYSEYNNLFLHCLRTNLNKVYIKFVYNFPINTIGNSYWKGFAK